MVFRVNSFCKFLEALRPLKSSKAGQSDTTNIYSRSHDKISSKIHGHIENPAIQNPRCKKMGQTHFSPVQGTLSGFLPWHQAFSVHEDFGELLGSRQIRTPPQQPQRLLNRCSVQFPKERTDLLNLGVFEPFPNVLLGELTKRHNFGGEGPKLAVIGSLTSTQAIMGVCVQKSVFPPLPQRRGETI